VSGLSFLDYIGLPDWYGDRGQMALDVDDALLEAAEAVVAEWSARDPLVGVALDGRWDLWTWHRYPIADLPVGTRIRSRDWEGVIAPMSRSDQEWHVGEVFIQWASGTGYQPNAYRQHSETVDARVPVPVDLAAAISVKAQDTAR
jgi:hypothetical protein